MLKGGPFNFLKFSTTRRTQQRQEQQNESGHDRRRRRRQMRWRRQLQNRYDGIPIRENGNDIDGCRDNDIDDFDYKYSNRMFDNDEEYATSTSSIPTMMNRHKQQQQQQQQQHNDTVRPLSLYYHQHLHLPPDATLVASAFTVSPSDTTDHTSTTSGPSGTPATDATTETETTTTETPQMGDTSQQTTTTTTTTTITTTTRHKTIGMLGSLAIAVNSLAGPAILQLPYTYQQAGIIPTTVALIAVAFLSALVCMHMANIVSKVPLSSFTTPTTTIPPASSSANHHDLHLDADGEKNGHHTDALQERTNRTDKQTTKAADGRRGVVPGVSFSPSNESTSSSSPFSSSSSPPPSSSSSSFAMSTCTSDSLKSHFVLYDDNDEHVNHENNGNNGNNNNNNNDDDDDDNSTNDNHDHLKTSDKNNDKNNANFNTTTRVNSDFDELIEFSDTFKVFWSYRAYYMTQIIFYCCTLCMNIAAIVDTAQVVDSVLGHRSSATSTSSSTSTSWFRGGNTYALSFMDGHVQVQEWNSYHCGKNIDLTNTTIDAPSTMSTTVSCSPFESNTGTFDNDNGIDDAEEPYGNIVFTLGYAITAAVFMPICLMDLKENTAWQIFGFFVLLTISTQFIISFIIDIENHNEASLLSSSPSSSSSGDDVYIDTDDYFFHTNDDAYFGSSGSNNISSSGSNIDGKISLSSSNDTNYYNYNNDSYVTLWGQTWDSMMGIILFNFGLVLAIPAWLGEKHPSVHVGTVVYTSTGISLLLYISVGILGALAIPNVPANVLEPMVSGMSLGTSSSSTTSSSSSSLRIGASLFAFFIIGLDIPLFTVLTRYNLIHSKLCSTSVANIFVVYMPWSIGWMFYQGTAISELLSWGGVLFTGVLAFILPLYLAVLVLKQEEEEEEEEEKETEKEEGKDDAKRQDVTEECLNFETTTTSTSTTDHDEADDDDVEILHQVTCFGTTKRSTSTVTTVAMPFTNTQFFQQNDKQQQEQQKKKKKKKKRKRSGNNTDNNNKNNKTNNNPPIHVYGTWITSKKWERRMTMVLLFIAIISVILAILGQAAYDQDQKEQQQQQ